MSEPAFTTALSYEDYLHLPDDGRRYELVEGDLFVTAAPVPKHQRVVIRLIYALEGWSEATGGGEVLTAPLDVLLAPNTVVQPDVVVVLAGHADRLSDRGIEGAPDLVIEVLSERTRRHDDLSAVARASRWNGLSALCQDFRHSYLGLRSRLLWIAPLALAASRLDRRQKRPP